ncbi:MAG: hypothetical protein ACJ77K_16610 [Bacteroidia bacterium]
MDKKSMKGMLVASVVTMSTGFANFSRIEGTDNIRAVAVVTILACGAGMGIFLMTLIMLIKKGKSE